MNTTFVGDIKESNDNTIKENNSKKQHNIPIGTLVEIITWDNDSYNKYNGLRLFVVKHERDCDGTPLYGMSWDKEVINKDLNPYESDHHLTKLIKFANNSSIIHGFNENCLKIVK